MDIITTLMGKFDKSLTNNGVRILAKLRTDPINATDLSEYLNSVSDFSFELSVLKMLREHNITCEHGGHYQDPITNKSREFDIRAKTTVKHYHVRMSVECKNIRSNFPIIISCAPRHLQESYHQIAVVTEPPKSNLSWDPCPRSRARIINIDSDFTIYKRNEPVGKSTAQVGRTPGGEIFSSDSELYDKWGQCLSSATDLVKQIYWEGEGTEIYFATVIPFVVVPNDRLWVVIYNEEGDMTKNPTTVDRCSCFIDKEYVMGVHNLDVPIWLSHVEIVTIDGMKRFIEEYLKTEEGLENIFPFDGIEQKIKEKRKRFEL